MPCILMEPIFCLDEQLADMCYSSLQVVLNVGLCIALHDITRLEDSYIFPGDGAAHTKVHFRYVVFRPFMEEVIIGKIRSCSRDGVHGKICLLMEYNLASLVT